MCLNSAVWGEEPFKKEYLASPLHVGPNLWGREGVSDTSSHSEMDIAVLENTIRLSIRANLISVWGVLDTRIHTHTTSLLTGNMKTSMVMI